MLIFQCLLEKSARCYISFLTGQVQVLELTSRCLCKQISLLIRSLKCAMPVLKGKRLAGERRKAYLATEACYKEEVLKRGPALLCARIAVCELRPDAWSWEQEEDALKRPRSVRKYVTLAGGMSGPAIAGRYFIFWLALRFGQVGWPDILPCILVLGRSNTLRMHHGCLPSLQDP